MLALLTTLLFYIYRLSFLFRNDSRGTLSKEVDTELFNLKNKKSNFKVEITQPTKANYLMDELDTTFRDFEPVNNSFFTKLLSKEVTKGFQKTEKMLKNGTILYAFGKLEKTSDNKYRLLKPDDLDFEYIITKKTPIELIDDMTTSKKNH